MAKKRFRIKDSQGNVVPYDVAAEDVTMADGRSVEAGKASLKAVAGFLDPAHFPKLMLYNVIPLASGADVSSIPVGIVYLSESLTAPYKRLFYKKSVEGTTQSIDLGAPQDGVIYCHLSTGKLYRWEPSNSGTDGSFTQVGGDGDLKDSSGHIKQSIAAVQVLRFVSNPVAADLVDGDIYYSLGGLQYYSNGAITPLGSPSKYLTYYCVADGKFYRWNGSSMTAVTVIPHIDPQTGNWFIGATDTGMPSQGPRGNTVVLDPNQVEAFDIINNLTDGGEGDALSAEMGKWLYTTLYTIFSQLGSYAFQNGKPQIDWGGGNPPVIPPCTVSKTIGTGLSSTGGDSDVAFGDPLEVTIAITNNLYVVDDDSVVVTMGGSPVVGAWNASTMKVTIAAVTGNVVINVPSMTYVADGLVLHLDGKNQGSTTAQWANLCNENKPLVLSHDYSQESDYVAFNTSVNSDEQGNGLIDQLNIDMPYKTTTVETVIMPSVTPSNSSVLLVNNYVLNTIMMFGKGSGTYLNRRIMQDCTTNYGSSSPSDLVSPLLDSGVGVDDKVVANQKVKLSRYGETWVLNENTGFPYTTAGTGATLYVGTDSSVVGDFSVSGFVSRQGTYLFPFKGNVYAIRIYNRVLDATERARNFKIDKKRFNLS